MNPPDPALDAATYVAVVLVLYVDLPDTPLRASVQDQKQARRLYDRGIPLRLVESALLLASLRRLVRPADVPPLPPIRSLAYFAPVVEELLAHPVPDNYLQYLRLKLRRMAGEKIAPADVQKSTFSGDR
ncbi:MAG TPA: hypothetical protein VNJ47_11475 [Nevskiales bacterium]|nr:hypothetical protein [Nevskiales bacterium]